MQVTNYMLISLDGELATSPREDHASRLAAGLTNAYDHAGLREALRSCDGAVIGAETLRADGEVLAIKNDAGVFPIWMVATRQGLAADLTFWSQSEVPRVILCPQAKGLQQPGVDMVTYGHQPAGQAALAYFRAQGAKRILVLGGGHINKIFYDEGLIDELKLAIAPMLIGRGHARLVATPLARMHRMQLLSSQAIDDFLYLHYRVSK